MADNTHTSTVIAFSEGVFEHYEESVAIRRAPVARWTSDSVWWKPWTWLDGRWITTTEWTIEYLLSPRGWWQRVAMISECANQPSILSRLRQWQSDRYSRGEETSVCAVHPETWNKVKRAIVALDRVVAYDSKGNPRIEGTLLVADSSVDPETFEAR